MDIGCDVAHIDSCNFGDFLVSLALEAVVKEDLPHGFGHFVDLAFDDGFYFCRKGCFGVGTFQNGDFGLVIITPNIKEFADLNGKMTPELIRSSKFVSREYGSGTRKESENFLLGIGIDPQSLKISVQLESTESVIQAVKNNLGIAIVSKYACEDCLAAGNILAFDYESPDLSRSFYTVYRKNRPLSPAAEAFVKGLKETFGRQ